MALLLTLAIALTLSCYQTWAFPSQQQQQTYLADNNLHIRPATEADLDDIVTVVIDAFAPSPAWRYIFPHQDDYKEYRWKCLRKEVGQNFAPGANDSFVNVISVPVGLPAAGADMHGERAERVVAVAAWEILEPVSGQFESESMGMLGLRLGVRPNGAKCSDNIDANMTRAEDYNRQFSFAQKHYLTDFPQKQLYLGLLATHPDWDGHGFGAAHCQWGMKMAKSMDVPVTLIATPAGWPLYDLLGFESIANITIETLDESDDLWFEYMRYDN